MNDDGVLWYRCENDFCLRYHYPTDVFPTESVECSECGQMMSAIYPPSFDIDVY